MKAIVLQEFLGLITEMAIKECFLLHMISWKVWLTLAVKWKLKFDENA